ncbi:hypothetical protein [Clostridium sp. C2-6-12]|uniref:hypothetical protein n=1 Tax=Clostridium sp. C2-6-12 TaxID=2698832 RepID=UPI0013719B4B|nr:hypothetical protein [Clostridium sp. C2-6-12]
MSFIFNMIKADKNNEKADKINIKAFEKIEEAKINQKKYQENMDMSLEKLINRKKGILSTSIREFLEIYEKIMKIDFEEGDGIKELSMNMFAPEVVNELKNTVTTAVGNQLTTKQAIITYLFGGISGIIAKEAEMNLGVANIRKRQANVIEAHSETICIALNAIIQRCDRISEILAKLNLLFMKSIKTTGEIISQKGMNRLNYTKSDKEAIMTCINIASTIKKILDTKLFDEKGEITKQSIEAIQIGDQYLNEINNTINK